MKSLIVLACLLCLTVGVVIAGESGPVMNGKPSTRVGKTVGKSECPKECGLRAKAALAMSATKRGSTKSTKPTSNEKVTVKDCPCGEGCKCEPGVCPSCPTSKVAKAPTSTYFQRGNTVYECRSGVCRAVGTVSGLPVGTVK